MYKWCLLISFSQDSQPFIPVLSQGQASGHLLRKRGAKRSKGNAERVRCWSRSQASKTMRSWGTSRARASRGDGSFKRGKNLQRQGGPIGTATDRLAVTAVDCVISEKSLSLTFLNSRHLCLTMPQSLDLACFWHVWILTDLPFCGSLSRRLFSPWHFSLNFLFWWCQFLPTRFAQSTS